MRNERHVESSRKMFLTSQKQEFMTAECSLWIDSRSNSSTSDRRRSHWVRTSQQNHLQPVCRRWWRTEVSSVVTFLCTNYFYIQNVIWLKKPSPGADWLHLRILWPVDDRPDDQLVKQITVVTSRLLFSVSFINHYVVWSVMSGEISSQPADRREDHIWTPSCYSRILIHTKNHL